MSFSFFTVNNSDVMYLNGTVTVKFKPFGYGVPLSNDDSNVRLCLAFLDPTHADTTDTLGQEKPATNYYEQIIIDIPSF